jgi:hypothetical protein
MQVKTLVVEYAETYPDLTMVRELWHEAQRQGYRGVRFEVHPEAAPYLFPDVTYFVGDSPQGDRLFGLPLKREAKMAVYPGVRLILRDETSAR